MRIWFTSFDGAVKWLATNPIGNDCVRDVLYWKPELLREFFEREFVPATYVLVKAYGDGLIEVYGEKHVRVRVVELPVATSVEAELALDEFVELSVKWPYRMIHFPSNKRTSAVLTPYLSMAEFLNREAKRDLDLEDIRLIEEWGARIA